MGAGGKLRHVRTDFGQNRGRGFLFDPRDRLQQSVRLLELLCRKSRTDFYVQRFNLRLKKIDVPKSVPQEEPVMIRQTMPAERGDQLRNLLSGLALCKLRDLLRWQDAFQESVNQ